MKPIKDDDDEVKSRIVLDISAFLIKHSDDLDVLDVYLVLSAALAYIEDEAEAVSRKGGSRKEGSYLQ